MVDTNPEHFCFTGCFVYTCFDVAIGVRQDGKFGLWRRKTWDVLSSRWYNAAERESMSESKQETMLYFKQVQVSEEKTEDTYVSS
jgi:hypothetical protein